MGKLKQMLIDACEKIDWTVREYEDGSVELEKYSPAGEDFIVSASAETFVRDVKQYAADFVTLTNTSKCGLKQRRPGKTRRYRL